MEVRFRSDGCSISGEITAEGEVRFFRIEDGEGGYAEMHYETFQRLHSHLELERNRILYPRLVAPAVQTGVGSMGGNKDPDPPIEGELDG